MAELNLEEVIKSGVERALNAPIVNGKTITEWAAIGMKSPNWVSVNDRLPAQKWTDYLVATRILTDGTRGYNIAWLNDDNGVWKSNDEWICDGREIVTHWRPLPPLPKEVTRDENC